MINHPDFAKRDTSSLQSIGGGGAPTPVANVEKINQKFKGGKLVLGRVLYRVKNICRDRKRDMARHDGRREKGE